MKEDILKEFDEKFPELITQERTVNYESEHLGESVKSYLLSTISKVLQEVKDGMRTERENGHQPIGENDIKGAIDFGMQVGYNKARYEDKQLLDTIIKKYQ